MTLHLPGACTYSLYTYVDRYFVFEQMHFLVVSHFRPNSIGLFQHSFRSIILTIAVRSFAQAVSVCEGAFQAYRLSLLRFRVPVLFPLGFVSQ
jgi:hypothetical protein